VAGGKSLLFTSTTEQGDDRWDRADIVLQSLKTGERKTLIHGGSDAHYLPTGHLIYALGGTLFAVPLDVKNGAVRGGSVPVLDGVLRALPNSTAAAHYAISTNGTLVYVPSNDTASVSQRSLALVERNSGKVRLLPLPPQNYSHPRFSPDGKQLVFATQDGRDSIVWIYDLKGDRPPRKLTLAGSNIYPIWNRDGRSITFAWVTAGDWGIFQQLADGTGTAERLTAGQNTPQVVPEAWGPDGRTLLLATLVPGAGTGGIMMLSLDGEKKLKPLLADSPPGLRQGNSAFSPDGRWLAYNSFGNAGASRVFVEPFPPTGSRYELPDGGPSPVWSPDGKQLLYRAAGTGNRIVSVDVQTTNGFTFGKPTTVAVDGFLPGNFTSRDFDISPDGKQFVAALDSSAGQIAKQPNPQINVVLNWFIELQQRVPMK
jgi:Tol biopolymer transport system component